MATKGSVYLASAALAACSSGDIGAFASAACARETFGKTTSSVEATTSDNRNIGRKRILAPLEGAQVCSLPRHPSTQTSCSGVRVSCSIHHCSGPDSHPSWRMLPPIVLTAAIAALVYNGRANETRVPVPRIEADITVNGTLDEAVWRQAAVLTGFSEFAPQDGIPAADSTEVLVWYSPTAVYFGIRAFEKHGAPHATLADRDKIS